MNRFQDKITIDKIWRSPSANSLDICGISGSVKEFGCSTTLKSSAFAITALLLAMTPVDSVSGGNAPRESKKQRQPDRVEFQAAETPQVVAQRGSFDPDTCWQDSGGKIIIRLISGLAFAFEPTYFSARVSWGPIVGPDLPPEGCPGNPLLVKSIRFPNWPDWPVAEGALKHKTNQLERLGIFGHEGPLHLQRGDLRLFEISIKQYGTEHCEILPGQLEVCRACISVPDAPDQCSNGNPPPGSNRPKTVGYDRVPAWYRALPGAYFEHNSLPFAGYCTWPVLIDTPRWCQFQYQIQDGLTVSYKINDWKVPETEFIAFDRKIREMTLAARAPEYDAIPEEMEQFQ